MSRLLALLFGKPERANAASELALARAEMRAAVAEHQRNWDAFTASGERIKAAEKRIKAAREIILDEAEAWALSRDSGRHAERENSRSEVEAEGCQSGPEPKAEGIAQTSSMKPASSDPSHE